LGRAGCEFEDRQNYRGEVEYAEKGEKINTENTEENRSAQRQI